MSMVMINMAIRKKGTMSMAVVKNILVLRFIIIFFDHELKWSFKKIKK
jgi:hypothetical protein